MRIAIVGSGAIGGWIAARLALAGNPVGVLTRGRTLEAVRDNGLTVSEAGASATARPVATDDPQMLGRQDLVVITVKAPGLAEAAEQSRPLIGPDTIVLPTQNGVPWWFLGGEPLASVDPGGRIAAALPVRQVVGCVVHAACSRTAPNHVDVRHAERLILGEPAGGNSARTEQLRNVFAEAGIRCDSSAGIRQAIWYKLWGNATINPLSALTRATADRLLADPAIRALMAEAMDELAEIGAAIGCPISEGAEDRMAVTERLGAFKSSMLQDVEAGRPIELEALLGAPLEIARRAGVPAPQLDRIHAMTRLLAETLELL